MSNSHGNNEDRHGHGHHQLEHLIHELDGVAVDAKEEIQETIRKTMAEMPGLYEGEKRSSGKELLESTLEFQGKYAALVLGLNPSGMSEEQLKGFSMYVAPGMNDILKALKLDKDFQRRISEGRVDYGVAFLNDAHFARKKSAQVTNVLQGVSDLPNEDKLKFYQHLSEETKIPLTEAIQNPNEAIQSYLAHRATRPSHH